LIDFGLWKVAISQLEEFMQLFFNKTNHKLLDINIFTPLHKRIFVTVLFMSILVTLIGILLNLILGLNEYLTLLFVISFLFSIVIFFLVKKRNSDELQKYYYLYWIGIFSILPSVWILGGGIDGSLMILFVLIYIRLFLTTREKRGIALVISVLFIVALILFDYYFPNIIIRFESKEQRTVYLVKAFVVYLVFIHCLLEFIMIQNKIEHRRLETYNKKLNEIVAENKSLSDKLEESLKEMENANVSKDRFISIIAHDLRSPFQGLLGFSRLLKENYDQFNDEDKRQLLEKLNNLVEKQYSFLEELLLWGRLQKSNIAIKVESVNIKESILSEIVRFNHQIEKKKLEIKILNGDTIEVETDKNFLSTVFRNVLSNAIKFSTFGQKIEIFIEQFDNTCHIKFRDYGIGISEEDLSNLFRLDSKVSRKGTDGETGSGFGLVICNEIMNKLNGKIIIDSKEGKGTTVTITLPIKKII
jgi:signal transduction histidine kinase